MRSSSDIKFSVIMPNYNGEKYLEQAIESVLSQNCLELELIIVDDGSTDSSRIILSRYEENSNITIILQENSGIPAVARNIGIKNSVGEWILFLDSDDFWYKEKIEATKNFIEENSTKNIVAFGTFKHDYFENEKGPITKYSPPAGDSAYLDLILKGNCFSNSTTCVSRKAIEKVGGLCEDPNYFAVEDYDLWLRLSRIGNLGMIPTSYCGYRVHKGNISGNASMMTKNLTKVVLYHIDQLGVSQKDRNKLKSKMTSLITYYEGRKYLRDKRFKESIPHLLNSIKTHPFVLKKWMALFFSLIRVSV